MRTATIAVKPAGGYKLAWSDHLTEAWDWYQAKLLYLADLRVYLACHEMVARRCGRPEAIYNNVEVSRLTGLKKPDASLARLRSAGLLVFEESTITFPDPGGRRVPFPRRMLRHLARHGTRSLIATVFGHLLRCLWYHDHECHSGGLCKASKIADRFGVNLRRVKAARAELLAMGWLERVAAPQWVLNREGGDFRINLQWGELPPPLAILDAPLPPPDLDRDPPEGFKDQKPEETGVSIKHVKPEDLADTGRTLELHAQAAEAGIVGTSEADRLHVVAAAEHARTHATINACGMFVRMLKDGLWRFLTHDDEDQAASRIRRHLYGGPIATAHCTDAIAPTQSRTIPDWEIVAEVKAAATRDGYRGDPFYLLRKKDSTWTRPRWDAACQKKAPLFLTE